MMFSSFLICIFCVGVIWFPSVNTYNTAFKIPISLDSHYLKDDPELVWSIVFPKVMDSEESISIFKKFESLVNTLVNPSKSNQYYPTNIQAIEYSETNTELISPIKIIDKNLLIFPKPEYNAHIPVSKLSGGGLIDTLQTLHLKKLENQHSNPLEIVTIILDSNTEIIYQKNKCLLDQYYKILLYKPSDNINDLLDLIISLVSKADMNVNELHLWNNNKSLNHKHNLSCNFEKIESHSSRSPSLGKRGLKKFNKHKDFRFTLYWIHPQFNVGLYSEEIQKFITNSTRVSNFFDVLKPLSNLELIFIPFYIDDNKPKGFSYDVSPRNDNSPAVLATVLPAKSYPGVVQPFWLEYTVPLINQYFNTIVPLVKNSPNHFISILSFSNEDMSVLPTNQSNGNKTIHDQIVQNYNHLLDGCIRILYEPITTSTQNALLSCNTIIRNRNDDASLERNIAEHIQYLYNEFRIVAEEHNVWKYFTTYSPTKEPVLIDLYFISPDVDCLKGIDQLDLYNFYVKLPQIKKIFEQYLNAHLNLGYGKYKNLNEIEYVLNTDEPNVHQALTSSPRNISFTNSECGRTDDGGTLEYARTISHPKTSGFRNKANKYIILFYDSIQHPDVSWMYGIHMEAYFSIFAAQNERKGYHLFIVTSPDYSKPAKSHYSQIQNNTPYNIIVYDKNKDSLNHKISYAILKHLKLDGVINA